MIVLLETSGAASREDLIDPRSPEESQIGGILHEVISEAAQRTVAA